jgi:hypothetical protein
MRFRLSWVSVAVGLLVAALFLVPTASRSDLQEIVLADGTIERQLVIEYISLGSHLIGYFFLRDTSRLDQVSIALDRYGHLYPESDAALRDRLDATYSAGERDQGAALVELFRERLRPQRGHGTR